MRFVIASVGLVVGALGVVAGEADDSPGLQLLGVLVAIGTVAFAARAMRRRRRGML